MWRHQPVTAPFAVLLTLTALTLTLINTLTTPSTSLQMFTTNIQVIAEYVVTWSALLALLFTFTDTYSTATTTPRTISRILIPLHVTLTVYVVVHAGNIAPTSTTHMVVLTVNTVACLLYLSVYTHTRFSPVNTVCEILP